MPHAIFFMKDGHATSLDVFNILNFMLQFMPTDLSERDLMARFAKIGIGAGRTFDPSTLSPEMRTALCGAWPTPGPTTTN